MFLSLVLSPEAGRAKWGLIRITPDAKKPHGEWARQLWEGTRLQGGLVTLSQGLAGQERYTQNKFTEDIS